jgi:hypothetical protein
MKQLRFFAVDDDLLNVLIYVERDLKLQYVKAGVFRSQKLESYQSARDIPKLGVANADAAVSCDSYLVAESSVVIRPRAITLQNGETRFGIDQLVSSTTVLLTPAGSTNGLVLYGTVSSAWADEASIKIFRMFERATKKHFQKIKAFWVGANALQQLRDGRRLTIAVQSPKEFDLTCDANSVGRGD